MPRTWVDRVVEKPRTFTMQNNADGTVTLIPAPGAVTQAGTPVNAANLNGIESELAAKLTTLKGTVTKAIFQDANYPQAYTGSFNTDGTTWGTPNDAAGQYYTVDYIPNHSGVAGYGTQILTCYFGTNVGNIFYRYHNGTAWGAWKSLSFKGEDLPLTGGTLAGTLYTKGSNGSIAVAEQGDPGIEVRSLGVQSAAYMNFHRPGDFAVRFGLDIDNVLKIGGWSNGAYAYRIIDAREYDLMNDLKGTQQFPTIVSGRVTQILHKNSQDHVLRADYFDYSVANQITEKRFLWTGQEITFRYHLDTLRTEVW